MGIRERILGPKSKYDRSLPYTYEARVRLFDDGDEYKSYFADTICGLVEYLDRNRVQPDEVTIYEVYRERELPIDARFFTTPNHAWLYKPDICRAFEQHYPGHIWNKTCSFRDRDRRGVGP